MKGYYFLVVTALTSILHSVQVESRHLSASPASSSIGGQDLLNRPIPLHHRPPRKTRYAVPFRIQGGDGGATTSSGKGTLGKVLERTFSALGMLGVLVAIIHYFQEDGLIGLVLLLQIFMYQEGTSVAHVTGLGKWWWFLTYNLAVNARLLLGDGDWVVPSYAMATVGIVTIVLRLNQSGAGPYHFRLSIRDLGACLTTVLLLLVPSSCWIAILQEYGKEWVIHAGLLVIINDTMAYVFGMLFGKHALLPAISPRKTWEGFIGAAVSTMGLSMLLPNHDPLLAAFVSFVAPFGGFVASVVKRANGKKDFGNLFPGHGGVVDRLDCQVMTAPFLYLFLRYLNPPSPSTAGTPV